MWNDLHCRPLSADWVEGEDDEVWMRKWMSRIPRFKSGCKCNEHWSKWYPANKPDYTTRDLYFAWTVKAHNAVNERLGKTIVSVDDMKALYLAKAV